MLFVLDIPRDATTLGRCVHNETLESSVRGRIFTHGYSPRAFLRPIRFARAREKPDEHFNEVPILRRRDYSLALRSFSRPLAISQSVSLRIVLKMREAASRQSRVLHVLLQRR